MPSVQSHLLDTSSPQPVFRDRNQPLGEQGEVAISESDMAEDELSTVYQSGDAVAVSD